MENVKEGMTPESFQERLEEILEKLCHYYDEHALKHDYIGPNEAKIYILELLKESLPEVRWTGKADPDGRFYKDWASPEQEGWNSYRTELLRRWGL